MHEQSSCFSIAIYSGIFGWFNVVFIVLIEVETSHSGYQVLFLYFREIYIILVHLQVCWHVPCGDVCYGDGNLVYIANDWHSALLPVYLKAYYRDNGLMKYTRSILVIHNIAHQVCSCLEYKLE